MKRIFLSLALACGVALGAAGALTIDPPAVFAQAVETSAPDAMTPPAPTSQYDAAVEAIQEAVAEVKAPAPVVVDSGASMVEIAGVIAGGLGLLGAMLVIFGNMAIKRLESVAAPIVGAEEAAEAARALESALETWSTWVVAMAVKRFGSVEIDVGNPLVAEAAREVVDRMPEKLERLKYQLPDVQKRLAERAAAKAALAIPPVSVELSSIDTGDHPRAF